MEEELNVPSTSDNTDFKESTEQIYPKNEEY